MTHPAGLLGRGRPTVLSLASGDQTSSPLVTLDMGREVGGLVSVKVTGASSPAPTLHACFSESTTYQALTTAQNDGEGAYAPGCDTANFANGYPGVAYNWDSDSHVLALPSSLPGTATDTQTRGGFRYLTLFLSSPGTIDLSGLHVHMTAGPAQKNLASYRGWFNSSSVALDKIWYAGAYTVQLDTAAANTLKSWPYATNEADQAASQMPGTTGAQEVILDGAKRDRDVWEGDLSVQGPVSYLSTGDTTGWTNSVAALGSQQTANGYVPAEGLVGPHNLGEEFTYGEYVMWFVNNLDQHWLYTGDRSFLDRWYPAAVRAETWLGQQVDSTGLLSFTSSGSCGTYAYLACGHLTYINALYDETLHQMASLAAAEHQTAPAATYASRAATLRATINADLWDPAAGAYRMSTEEPATYPQDANASAVLYGVAGRAQATAALAYLRGHNWSTYGSLIAPAGSAGVPSYYAPLPSALEVEGRLATGHAASAVTLMKRFWGYMLADPSGPQSTFWESVNAAGQPNIAQFTSLAHGWASGPTIALTQGLLGANPTGPGYSTWSVVPHPGGLSWAEGGIPTRTGLLGVRWDQAHDGRFVEHLGVPAATRGVSEIPTSGRRIAVRVDGRLVWNGVRPVGAGDHSAHISAGYVVIDRVGPGTHVVTGQPLR